MSIWALTSSGLDLPDLAKSLLKSDDTEPAGKNAWLQKVNEIINIHLADPQLSMTFLCAKLATSGAQLYRNMQALSGYSPSEYIRETGLQRAAKLLTTNSQNISEIAYVVGFNNLSYFSKAFQDFKKGLQRHLRNIKSRLGIPASFQSL